MNDITGAADPSPTTDLNTVTRITYNRRTSAYVLFDGNDIAVERVHRGQETEKPSPRWIEVSELVVGWVLVPVTSLDIDTYARPAVLDPVAAEPENVAAPATETPKPTHVLDGIDRFYYAADGTYRLERAGVIVEIIPRPLDPDSEESAAWNDITDARIDGDWTGTRVEYRLGSVFERIHAPVPLAPAPEPAEPANPYIAPEPVVARTDGRLVVKTLVQKVGYPEKLEIADQVLADHINAGWRVSHEQIVVSEVTLRYIRLQRREPVATNGHRSATVPASAYINAEPVMRMTIHPEPVDLSALRIANAIRQHGKDEVLDMLNQQVTDSARAAYTERLNQHTAPSRTAIPSLVP